MWEQVTLARLPLNSGPGRIIYAELCSTPDGLRVLWAEGGQLEWKLEQGDRGSLRATRILWRHGRRISSGEQLSGRSIWNWFGFYNYGERDTARYFLPGSVQAHTSFRLVIVPYWAASFVSGAWPIWSMASVVRHKARRRRRERAGLCPVCGYDLRATPGRCPECGRGVLVFLMEEKEKAI